MGHWAGDRICDPPPLFLTGFSILVTSSVIGTGNRGDTTLASWRFLKRLVGHFTRAILYGFSAECGIDEVRAHSCGRQAGGLTMRDVERTGNHVNAEWTTDNIPDLARKVIIVTGANSGLGFEAAKEFARRGARTILACRDMVKAQAALVRIRTEIPNAQAETMQLNLASLKSIHRFAEAFASHYDHLHVL